ncbi:Endoribonuclease L-PSP/chorismate mutase-like protein [Dactylonectria estremocensis]|uniref:Endoribonuclease L-PSP/chorismate mutase-like protein n=1 Tax=Dactylonectria estremocensis TaxID=1079267 RepID=A0A9P9JFK8_9HYPO|nr:Endoribonuclease L-PSP/chorismate mutase-like protein [Dactylonectria estremocensis]
MSSKQPVNRANFSSPLFSEAIIHNGLVYCSGKIGKDPKTGKLVGDDVAEQTKAALNLLASVLQAAGSDLTKMLKCNIFLTNMSDFAAMNAAYTAIVPDPKPARICVSVSDLGLGAKIEIDCIAIVQDAGYD